METNAEEQTESRDNGNITIDGVFPGRRIHGTTRYKLIVDLNQLADPFSWLKENFRSKIKDLIEIEDSDFFGILIYGNMESISESHPIYLPFQRFSSFHFEQILDLVEVFTISKAFIDMSLSFECEVTVYKEK